MYISVSRVPVIQPAENSSIRRKPQKNKPQAEFCSKLDTVKKSRDAAGVLNRRGRQCVARTLDGPRITSGMSCSIARRNGSNH